MFKKKSHTSFENNDFLEDIDAIMKKEKANYIRYSLLF